MSAAIGVGAPSDLVVSRVVTPIGEAVVAVDDGGILRAFDFTEHEGRMRKRLQAHYGGALAARDGRVPAVLGDRIDAYFSGDLAQLDAIECATGGTDFQRRVWAALREIPVGQTTSYGALAARIGSPRAVRAVGLANGANPIGVVVPCHRVIGANGHLTGYGGGLDRKRWLLRHEGVLLD